MPCNCQQGYVTPGVNRSPCGCQQGFTGGWTYGLGRPYGHYYGSHFGLGRLMGATSPPVAAGSHIQVGFVYNSIASSADSMNGLDDPAYMKNLIAGQIGKEGLVTDVNVTVKPPAWMGLQSGYITVDAWTAMDFPTTIALQAAFHNAIIDSGALVAITKDDTVAIQEVPPDRPDAQQPYDPRNPQCPQGTHDVGWLSQKCVPITDTSACSFADQTFSDWFQCEFGGAAIGSVATLLVVGLVGLVIFAKR